MVLCKKEIIFGALVVVEGLNSGHVSVGSGCGV